MTTPHPMRVLFHQPARVHYRDAFYNLLADRGFEIHVAVDSSLGRSYVSEMLPPPRSHTVEYVETKTFTINGRLFRWVPSHLSSEAGRVSVYPWDLSYLSLMPSLLSSRKADERTILWGHGLSPGGSSLALRARTAISRLADAVAVYTPRAAGHFRSKGVDCQFVGNALPDLQYTPPEIPPLRNGRLKLLSIARLDHDRGLRSFLAAVRSFALADKIDLHIVGSGKCESSLKAAAAGLPRVIFHGALYDSHEIAEVVSRCHAFVVPEHGGLTFLHALQYGRPVIAGRTPLLHGPEYEALKDNGNSLLYGSATELLEILNELTSSSGAADRLVRLGAAALKTSDEWSMSHMVTRFADLLRNVGADD